jgi:predicted esterase
LVVTVKPFAATVGLAVLLALSGAADARADSGYVFVRDTELTVGTETVQIRAGHPAVLIGRSEGRALVRVRLPSGRVAVVQIAENLLAPKDTPPAGQPSPESSPASPAARPERNDPAAGPPGRPVEPRLSTAAGDHVLKQDVEVTIGGDTVRLPAGLPVSVVNVHDGIAFVRLTLPSGRRTVAHLPEQFLAARPALPAESKPPAPVAAPASPPAAAVVRSPTPPPSPVVPAPVPSPLPVETAKSKTAAAPQSGWRKLTLEQLPVPATKPRWFRYDFNPADENFHVYIPRTYSADRPCGVLGWINPGDGAGAPKPYEPLFDEFRLIVVSAARSGNKQPSDRRVGLLVSATLELSKTYAIDPKRRVLSGFSGGGRSSALGAFVHSEFWCGAISHCGGNFYKDFPNPEKRGSYWRGINHPERHGRNAVTSDNVQLARQNGRFVLITGPNDFNLANSRALADAFRKDGFNVLLIEEPGLGHAIGSVQTMRQALEFVLGSPPK